MGRTDSTEMRVAAAVALTAALFSPRMRGMVRRGVVQGLAGVLTAGDAITSFARGVGRGMQEPSAPPVDRPAHSVGAAAPDPVTAPATATPTDAAPPTTAPITDAAEGTHE